MIRRLSHIFCALVLGCCTVIAQGVRDSKGRDFWIGVPPNDHSSGGALSPFISLLIDCDVAATVEVTGRSRNGVIDRRSLAISAGTVEEVRFSSAPYELMGVVTPNGATNDCERVSPASIHVSSTEDITVYAVLREDKTSDAWLVLPTDALGTEYRVMSYASNAVVDTVFGRVRFTELYASEFVVVGTEDGTDVSITLSVDRSAAQNNRTLQTRLNAGESFLVQARVTATRQNDDLTGSLVRSSKPVAAIGAHRRATVPILSESPSRDCLVEQVPPTDTWGKNIIVPPLFPARDQLISGPRDVPQCRVLATEDATTISINGAPPFQRDGGQFTDVELRQALSILSTKPILVSILDRSANRTVTTNPRSGDPSLIIIPPREQYLSSYRVVNVEPEENGTPVYTQHQITCIVPLSAVSTLLLDGAQTAPAIPVPGTNDAFVHFSVGRGVHTLQCDSAFGVIVYGYGPAESYGYTGGMAFERLYVPRIRLRVLDVAGFPGEQNAIVVIVDSIDNISNFQLSGVRELTATIDFNPSNFVPADTRTFTKQFDSLSVGDTVAVRWGVHVLGTDSVSASTLSNILWSNGAALVDIATTIVNGNVRTKGICTSPTARLFDPTVVRLAVPRFYDLTGKFVGYSTSGLPVGIYVQR